MNKLIKILALGLIGYFGYKALAKRNIVPKIPAVGLGRGTTSSPKVIGSRALPRRMFYGNKFSRM